ncbi:hypothetical protein DFH07DRAFT_726826 [Mycena maculata]|uniref:PROP1-like PPR domain-containing protein n=1 Tax=Mycena maculata TaxID=230809 RepID=A0AAD7P1P2_9AGAR|nr:hypothetical protein DFH07DRAFT_726826 [Mycena maculata]
MAAFSPSHLSGDGKHAPNYLAPSVEPRPVRQIRDATPKSPKLPPKEALLDLFLTVPQNAALLKRLRASNVLLEYIMDSQRMLDLLHDLACSKSPRAALTAINVARKLGCNLGINAYETVAFRLGARKDWELLLYVIRSAKHNTYQTTASLLNWRARALLETQNYTDLYRIFDLFQANNFRPSRRTWHLVLSGYIRNHDLTGAKDCLRDMEAAGFPPNHSTHALIGTLYQNIGPDEQVKERALEALPHVPGPIATATVNSLMQLRLRIYDLDEVSHLLSAFDQNKVGAVSLMLAASRAQHQDTAQQTTNFNPYSFPIIVAPDAVTFAMFIDYFAHLQELPRCLAVLDHMRVAGIRPTQRTLTSLIRAYFLTSHGGAAVRLVAAMCNPATMPPEFFKNVPSPEGHALALDITRLGPPSRQIFNCLLRGVLRTNGLPAARSVLRLMRENDVKPDHKTTQIIASHTQRIERARPRDIMRMIRGFAPRITLQQAHIVLASTMRWQKYLVDGIGWNVTAAKFSLTRRAPVKPYPEEFVSTVGSNFDPLAGIELPRRARQRGTFRPIEQSLADRGIKPDPATIALRIRHDAVIRGDMNSATEVFQTMLSRGLHPNQYHYSALMEGFAKSGDFESAVEVMRSASRASFEPDVLMFTILIVGYARNRDPDMALRIFRRMVAAGIKPDVPAIDAVASAFFFVGAYELCWRVLTSLWQHITPLPTDIEKTSLQSAVTYFRSLHRGIQRTPKTSREFRTALHRELALLFREWRYWQLSHSARLRPRSKTLA